MRKTIVNLFLRYLLSGAGIFLVCFGLSAQADFRVRILDFSTDKLIYVKEHVNLGDTIIFKSLSGKKYDIAKLILETSTTSANITIPIQRKRKHRLVFKEADSTDLFRLLVDGQTLSFDLNSKGYVSDYFRFIEDVDSKMSSKPKPFHYLIDTLAAFENTYKHAEIIGYHLYILKPMIGKQIPLDSEIKPTYQKLTGHDYKLHKETNCSGKTDKLLFQSGNSFVDESIQKEFTNVLIFWATWCSPCKKIMHELDSVAGLGPNKKIVYHAVNSEMNFRLSNDKFSQMGFKNLNYFDDDCRCMYENYQISQYPDIIIFDSAGNQIYRGIDLEEIINVINQVPD